MIHYRTRRGKWKRDSRRSSMFVPPFHLASSLIKRWEFNRITRRHSSCKSHTFLLLKRTEKTGQVIISDGLSYFWKWNFFYHTEKSYAKSERKKCERGEWKKWLRHVLCCASAQVNLKNVQNNRKTAITKVICRWLFISQKKLCISCNKIAQFSCCYRLYSDAAYRKPTSDVWNFPISALNCLAFDDVFRTFWGLYGRKEQGFINYSEKNFNLPQ